MFDLNTTGDAYGGNGGDHYFVYSNSIVGVTDTGTIIGDDYVYLKNIQSVNNVVYYNIDSDLYLTSASDAADGTIDSGVFIDNWFNGGNTIEYFLTADGVSFQVPGV